MQLPQIRLQSTSAQIQLNRTAPVQRIEQPKAELDIQQPSAEMTINRKRATLTIDQSQARADLGFKTRTQVLEEFVQDGIQGLMEGIARNAQEGDELMMIENGGSPLADQPARNAFDPPAEFNIGWIPRAGGVKVSYDPGSVDIQWKVNKVINNSRPQKAIHDYTPGKIEVAMQRYNSLEIDFVNLRHVGVNYEQQI
ncbi:DUF6470 family protein [Mangrovibacillus cuniculi]|uniref:Uncharacterized protein n=1 Tax=Mangrovibacillus cuniculi TaxID=2593652 RepID=A0A7S8HG49_9BACI|nr:DUF6470 family protein [Mangrovibacillus cuniculi]QPC47513.1 hypothetical protein G8O30_11420 [Mangrovibacillus cuniculi]